MSKKNYNIILVLFALLLTFGMVIGCAEVDPDEIDEVIDEEVRTGEIVFIPKNTGNPYFDGVVEGYQIAAEELDFMFSTTAPATPEATSQIPYIQTQIDRGVSVLGIAPNSPDALNEYFQQAMDNDIWVITVNSDIPGSEDYRHAAILPTDFDVLGAAQVELMGSLIDYEGEIAILSATADAPDQNYWIEGMKEALETDPKYENMELVAVVYGDDLPDKSQAEAEALLVSYPDLRGIIAPTTVGIAAASHVVESEGAAPIDGGQVEVTGLGLPSEMRRFIHNETVTRFALWNPVNEGRIAGHLSYKLKHGIIDELEPGLTFDVPELGTFEVLEDNIIIAGPPYEFDIENIDDFDF